MAKMYCVTCGNIGQPKSGMNMVIFILLLLFTFIGAFIYWAIVKGNKCRYCGSTQIVPLNSPMAINHQNMVNASLQQQQFTAAPVQMPVVNSAQQAFIPEPVQPTIIEEQYAIDKDINGGLIEFFGLKQWYDATFNDEQKHRLEQNYNQPTEPNKLANGRVKFKFANVDVLQFLYAWLDKLKSNQFDDVRPLIDDYFKHEANKFCQIDDDRWDNEQYYKSWFSLMKYRIDKLNQLKSQTYYQYAGFNPVKDNFTSQECLDLAGKRFNVFNGELDREFDKHFAEPIKGCRCNPQGIK